MEANNPNLGNAEYFTPTKVEKYIKQVSDTFHALQSGNHADALNRAAKQVDESTRERHKAEVINRLIKSGANITEDAIKRMDAYADWEATYNAMTWYDRYRAKRQSNKNENEARAKAKKKAKARAKRKASRR